MRSRNARSSQGRRTISKAVKRILEQALTLSEQQRVRLLEQVADSLSPETIEQDERDFMAELERRYQEYQRDPTKAKPWPEVHRRLLDGIKRKKRKTA